MSIRVWIAEWLENYCPKHDTTDSGWVIIPEVAKERYKKDATQILTHLKAEIEKMENPYRIGGKSHIAIHRGIRFNSYEKCKQGFIKLLEEE